MYNGRREQFANVNVDIRQVHVQMSTHVNNSQVGSQNKAKISQRSFWTTPYDNEIFTHVVL